MAIVFTANRWLFAIIIYIVIISIIVYLKPPIMFDAEKNPKKWGLENNDKESMFSPMIVFPILAIISYYIAAFVDMIDN
jgi:hypothetical protein